MTVILLHGCDSTAFEFGPELFESQGSDGLYLNQKFPNIKWIFPTASLILSERFQVEMSQWFDMWSTEDPHERLEIQVDMQSSADKVLEIVKNEIELLSASQVILGGISQGAATAMVTLLQQHERLGGFIGLSTWSTSEINQCTERSGALETPVLLGHCEDDSVISITHGRELRDRIIELGMAVEWHDYAEGGHWINEPDGVDDMARFITDNQDSKA